MAESSKVVSKQYGLAQAAELRHGAINIVLLFIVFKAQGQNLCCEFKLYCKWGQWLFVISKALFNKALIYFDSFLWSVLTLLFSHACLLEVYIRSVWGFDGCLMLIYNQHATFVQQWILRSTQCWFLTDNSLLFPNKMQRPTLDIDVNLMVSFDSNAILITTTI